jgi:hypothetical protein
MIQKAIYGTKDCAAEILVAASKRLGSPITKEGCFGMAVGMNIADAIADVSINNAEGACAAFKALHKATGADDLSVWASGHTNYQIAHFMCETARKLAQ